MIRIMCPHCERTFRTRVEGMGKTAICTGCHEPFRIGDKRPPFEWVPSDLGEDSWIGVPPPEEEKELRSCIMCDAPLNEGQVSCPECGANQVTGVVHKRKRRDADDVKESVWDFIPVRPLIIMAVIALVGAGLFWFMHSVARIAEKTADDLVDDAQVAQAAARVNDGAGEYEIREAFAGKVTDANLGRVAHTALNAQRADFRDGATWLVAAGDFTDVTPLLESDGANQMRELRRVLRAIGAHRLIELSNGSDPEARLAAARALCIRFQLDPDEYLDALTAATTADETIAVINQNFRQYPRATGTFNVIVKRRQAPFTALVEQIGPAFYLTLGSRRFTTADESPPTFTLPVVSWCGATGTAIDEQAVRRLMSGTVTLTSEFGVEWEGTIRLTTRQALPDGPPGFLPTGPLSYGARVEVPLRLERP